MFSTHFDGIELQQKSKNILSLSVADLKFLNDDQINLIETDKSENLFLKVLMDDSVEETRNILCTFSPIKISIFAEILPNLAVFNLFKIF